MKFKKERMLISLGPLLKIYLFILVLSTLEGQKLDSQHPTFE